LPVEGAVLEGVVAGDFTNLNTDAVYNIGEHVKWDIGERGVDCVFLSVSFIFRLLTQCVISSCRFFRSTCFIILFNSMCLLLYLRWKELHDSKPGC